MNLSAQGLSLIKSFEGYHTRLPDGGCTAYYCPAGVVTIGYGCTEGIRMGMVWTHDQAEAALRVEIAKFAAAVTRLVTVPMNQNQYDALVSFAYNCGEGALAHSTILRKFNAGDADGAAQAFGMWVKGGGRVLPGLVTRRAREAALFRTSAEAADEPSMPQAVEEVKPSVGEMHLEVHDKLKAGSWAYWANHLNIKSATMAAGGAMAFLQDHMVEIAAAGLFAVIAFELVQYAMRNKRMEA